MKRGVRMLLLANGGKDERRVERDPRRPMSHYDYPEMNYPWYEFDHDRVENRFRDRRGREHYDNGRFAPMRGELDHDVEGRRRYRRYRDGRFAPRSDWDEEEMRYPFTPFVPPVYERGGGEMNLIGFERNDRELTHDYSMRADHPRGSEMEHRYSTMMKGGATGAVHLTRDMAEEWMAGLKNEDGSKGPHWTMEQVKQVMQQKNVDADPLEFYVVMNSLYSDFEPVIKKFGVSNVDFYREMAKSWLKDKDAVPNKAAAYFRYIVR